VSFVLVSYCSLAAFALLFLPLLSGIHTAVASPTSVTGTSATRAVKPFHFDFLPFLHELPGNDLENFVDTGIVSSRNLMASVHSGPAQSFIVAQVFSGICNAPFEWDFSLRGIRVYKVRLRADNVDDNVVVYVLLELKKPSDGFVVRGLRGNRDSNRTSQRRSVP
jgi:hypothetical protein